MAKTSGETLRPVNQCEIIHHLRMSNEQDKGISSSHIDALWVEQFSTLVEIIMSLTSEEGIKSLSEDMLASEIVARIKSQLGGQRLYIPKSLSRMSEIYEAASKNGIPSGSDEIKNFFHCKAEVSPNTVYGGAEKISALKREIFGFDLNLNEISTAFVAMRIVEAAN
jgi:Mor family transcriptional regulator